MEFKQLEGILITIVDPSDEYKPEGYTAKVTKVEMDHTGTIKLTVKRMIQ